MNIDPSLPGAEVVTKGIADLAASRETPEGLTLLAAAPRLRRLGLEIPHVPLARFAELELYDHLSACGKSDPFSAYNALLRLVGSFAAALEAVQGRAKRAGTR